MTVDCYLQYVIDTAAMPHTGHACTDGGKERSPLIKRNVLSQCQQPFATLTKKERNCMQFKGVCPFILYSVSVHIFVTIR